MKKYIGIMIGVIVLAIMTGLFILYFKPKKELNEVSYPRNDKIFDLTIEAGYCLENVGVIDKYLETTQKGEHAILKIKNVISEQIEMDQSVENSENDLMNRMIIFDGKRYKFLSEEQNSDGEYTLFYKVSGSLPNAESKEVLYVLSNEKYSYEEISKSIFSSNLEEHLEFVLVCFANAE